MDVRQCRINREHPEIVSKIDNGVCIVVQLKDDPREYYIEKGVWLSCDYFYAKQNNDGYNFPHTFRALDHTGRGLGRPYRVEIPPKLLIPKCKVKIHLYKKV